MTPRLGSRLLAVLVPAVLLLPAAAHAERVVSDDAVGDVASDNSDATGVEPADPTADVPEPYVADPDNQTADIVRTVVDHRAGRLLVGVDFRDLGATIGDVLLVRVRTPERTHNVYVERRGKHTYTGLLSRSETPCGGLRTIVDAAADRMLVRVPTACVGEPRTVRVAVGVRSMSVTHDPESGDVLRFALDDAFRTGWDSSAGGIAFGPEVRRG